MKSKLFIIGIVLIVLAGAFFLFFIRNSRRQATFANKSPIVKLMPDRVVIPDSSSVVQDTPKSRTSVKQEEKPVTSNKVATSSKLYSYEKRNYLYKGSNKKVDTVEHFDSIRSMSDTSDATLSPRVFKKTLRHSNIGKLDTRSRPIASLPQIKDLKYGILGYSYPPTITVGSSKTIHAFISIMFPENKVRDTLVKIVIDDDKNETGDSVVIVKAIRLFKEVTMTLDCMDTVLKVSPNHPNASQQIDTLHGNKWSWSIYAKTADYPVSKLKLKITTKGPASYDEKTLTINIKVEPHILRRIYNYLINNPKVLVSSILIPLLGFFGTRYFNNKRKTNV
jgi:hypothetical protein